MRDSIIEYLKDPFLVIKVQNFFGVIYNKHEKENESSVIYSDRIARLEEENDIKQHKRIPSNTSSSSQSSYETDSSVEREELECTINNKFWYYLFVLGTALGDEIFYATFIPFWFWNVDGAVGRRVVLVWTVVMYIDEYFLSNVKTVDEVTERMRARVSCVAGGVGGAAGGGARALDAAVGTFPGLSVAAGAGLCRACARPAAARLLLYGQPYNPGTLEPVQPDARLAYEKVPVQRNNAPTFLGKRIVFAGDSAGANLIAGCTLKIDLKVLTEEPRFAEPIPNVTVALGRDASLPCVVEHLGTYKALSSLVKMLIDIPMGIVEAFKDMECQQLKMQLDHELDMLTEKLEQLLQVTHN